RQRTPAEGGAVLSRRNRGGEMFFRQERAERHSRSDWFGNGDDVGHYTRRYAEALEGEHFAGAAEAALDLIEDERGLMLVGEGAAGAQEVFGAFKNSAFAKDGLEHDGASVGIDGGAQPFDVVLNHEGHVFEQRLKTFGRDTTLAAPPVATWHRRRPCVRRDVPT